MKTQWALATAFMALTLAAAWAQQTAVADNRAPEGGAKATTEATNADRGPISEAGPSYVIGSEDTLLVSVWKEPDLTVTVPVRSDGMISVPLVDDVPAAGLTPMQLTTVLTEKLRKYLAAPRVTVIVTQIKTQRIYVLGEVLHTGPISLLPRMTVLQAIATAGLNQFANTKRIYLLRMDNGQQQKIAFNYREVVKGGDLAQNIPLKPGDTIVVP